MYRDEKSNLKTSAKISGLCVGKSDNQNTKNRLLLKEVALNAKTTINSLPKKHRQLKKTTH